MPAQKMRPSVVRRHMALSIADAADSGFPVSEEKEKPGFIGAVKDAAGMRLVPVVPAARWPLMLLPQHTVCPVAASSAQVEIMLCDTELKAKPPATLSAGQKRP